jgi:hypothetical protein
LQKLKLFPATLKGATLRWFMGLGGGTITSWDDMKKTFLEKYQEYCRSQELREEIFKMTQKEDENLEDYVEWFQYNLQRSSHTTLGGDILKTILIRGMQDEWLDMLNLMGKGDISKESYEAICDLCRRCSRGISRSKLGIRDFPTRATKSTNGGVTHVEIGNLLEEFKTDILGILSSQLDVFQAKQKQLEDEKALAIFCPEM